MSTAAYVVSDYPILSSGIRRWLEQSYVVVDLAWDDVDRCTDEDVRLIVLDVTGVRAGVVLSLLSRFTSPAVIAVSSLDQNEVDLYEVGPAGLTKHAPLPSLLALSA